MSTNLDTIGHTEPIDIVDFGLSRIPAKIDTGADISSIWVSQIEERDDGLYGVFFGPSSPYHTGQSVLIANSYTVTRVVNSFGHREPRYKVKLNILVKGRHIRATFSLADRSLTTYPILLGRRLLRGKFLVDVSQSHPLASKERLKARRAHKRAASSTSQRGEV